MSFAAIAVIVRLTQESPTGRNHDQSSPYLDHGQRNAKKGQDVGAYENGGQNQYEAVQSDHPRQRCSSALGKPARQRQEYGRVPNRVNDRKQRADNEKGVLNEIAECAVHTVNVQEFSNKTVDATAPICRKKNEHMQSTLEGSKQITAALLLLTFATGLVDAASYLGLGHVFTANMTGNVVLLGFAMAGTPGLSVSRALVSLGAFLVGATTGGRYGTSMAVASRRRWLVNVAVCESVLLLIAAFVSIGLDPGSNIPASRLYGVIVLTAFAMGLRNATVRKLAIPDLTTTVLTLTLTGLAADSSIAGGNNPRLGRRVTSVLLIVAGAAVGAGLLRLSLLAPLAASGLCALGAAVVWGSLPAETEVKP